MTHRPFGQADGRSPETDDALIAAANRGDEAAMEALYLRYRDWVHACALRFCRDREDAPDVVQEIFLYLFRQFPGFRLRHRLKTFLYPVVRNLAIDRGRRRTAEPLPDGADLPAPPERDPGAERRGLDEIVAPLPEEQREVVLLRFADGMSLAEIAGALGLPVGTVKSRLHHALERLRRRLAPPGGKA